MIRKRFARSRFFDKDLLDNNKLDQKLFNKNIYLILAFGFGIVITIICCISNGGICLK